MADSVPHDVHLSRTNDLEQDAVLLDVKRALGRHRHARGSTNQRAVPRVQSRQGRELGTSAWARLQP
eukprot:659326-Pyramimonas_sp.AAC.1